MAKMTLTEFVDIFCKNDGRYDKLDDKTKSSFYFIFNRLMYYKYPTSANFFNNINIETSRVMDFWRIFLIFSNNDKSSLKSWIYKALTSNSNVNKNQEVWFPDDSKALYAYIKRYHMDMKTFKEHIKFNLHELRDDYDEFLKYYNADNENKYNK